MTKKEADFPTRQWCSSFKNPRIVRVSRTFGGKDRHSKVCTIRGLRDRRIRLSVPTAIQLYDLQHKLGLSQPSKVVDWLIDASKHEIDKLPPLPMIPTSHLMPPNSPRLMKIDETRQGCNTRWNIASHQDHHEGFVAQNLYNNPNFFFHWDTSQFGGESSYLSAVPPPLPPPPPPPYIHQAQTMENDYFRHINHLQQNSVFPTTLHFITQSHQNNTPKEDNKE